MLLMLFNAICPNFLPNLSENSDRVILLFMYSYKSKSALRLMQTTAFRKNFGQLSLFFWCNAIITTANKGDEKSLGEDKKFLAGLNVHKGMVTYKAVADVFGHEFVEPEKAITS